MFERRLKQGSPKGVEFTPVWGGVFNNLSGLCDIAMSRCAKCAHTAENWSVEGKERR